MVLSSAERSRRWREAHKEYKPTDTHTQMEPAPTVHKMRVVGPREAVALYDIGAQRKQAKAIRDYNPTLNAMAETQAEMREVLDNEGRAALTNKRAAMSNKRGAPKRSKLIPSTESTATASVAVYNACLERLRALESQLDRNYIPLLQIAAQNAAAGAPVAPAVPPVAALPAIPPPPPGLPPPPPARSRAIKPHAAATAMPGTPIAPMAGATTPPTLTPAATPARTYPIDEDRVTDAIPRSYKGKYQSLHAYMVKNPDLIGMSDTGQLVIRGVPLRGTSFTDVMRGLYTSKSNSNPMAVPGLYDALGVLSYIGVPSSLITVRAVRDQYSAMYDAQHATASVSGRGGSKKQGGAGRITDCFPGKTVRVLKVFPNV